MLASKIDIEPNGAIFDISLKNDHGFDSGLNPSLAGMYLGPTE